MYLENMCRVAVKVQICLNNLKLKFTLVFSIKKINLNQPFVL